MRCAVKAAILLLGPAIGYALPTHTEDYNAATEERSVVWWRGQSSSMALFCSDGGLMCLLRRCRWGVRQVPCIMCRMLSREQ